MQQKYTLKTNIKPIENDDNNLLFTIEIGNDLKELLKEGVVGGDGRESFNFGEQTLSRHLVKRWLVRSITSFGSRVTEYLFFMPELLETGKLSIKIDDVLEIERTIISMKSSLPKIIQALFKAKDYSCNITINVNSGE